MVRDLETLAILGKLSCLVSILMQSLPKSKARPEARIARDWRLFLKARGWRTKGTHGSVFQKGFPDDFAFHLEHGQRWIDYKVAGRNTLTLAQQREWPEWDAYGVGIWILTDPVEIDGYRKLFGAPNWREFWKPRYGHLQDADKLLEEMAI